MDKEYPLRQLGPTSEVPLFSCSHGLVPVRDCRLLILQQCILGSRVFRACGMQSFHVPFLREVVEAEERPLACLEASVEEWTSFPKCPLYCSIACWSSLGSTKPQCW